MVLQVQEEKLNANCIDDYFILSQTLIWLGLKAKLFFEYALDLAKANKKTTS
jgi:hypothetical protein